MIEDNAKDTSPTKMSRRSGRPTESVVASRLLIFALVSGILYFGKVVLVPLALAVLVSFVLYPLVRALQKVKLPRVPAVIIVMVLVSACVAAAGWMVAVQVQDLAKDLPRYRDNIAEKVRDVRGMTRGGTLDEIKETIAEIDEEVQQEEKFANDAVIPPLIARESTSSQPSLNKADTDEPEKPVEVTLVPESGVLGLDFSETIFPFLNPIGTAGIVLILTVFILVKREDLCDRLVSFAGPGQLLTTIRALNDAGTRISRYLLTQALVNGGYGVVLGIGLYFLSIPYAALWGLSAALLRYIPYVGPWVSALLPISVSMIISSGWDTTLLVIALFLVLEVISNNVVEPMFYGKSVGISEFAVLVSAMVWAWLWGPLGLVLATPVSVCLVVLGQHVKGLGFFSRLMVGQSVIDPSVQLYHRLVSGADEDAFLHVSQCVAKNGWSQTVEGVLLPTLGAARQDQQRGNLDDSEAERIKDVMDDLVEQHCSLREDGDVSFEHTVLVCPAGGSLDAAALELAEHTIESDHRSCDIVNLSSRMLGTEVAEAIADAKPVAVVVAGLPPDDLTYVRRWCRSVRRRSPDTHVIAARWGIDDQAKSSTKEVLKEAGANAVVTSPAELWQEVSSRLRLSPKEVFIDQRSVPATVQR